MAFFKLPLPLPHPSCRKPASALLSAALLLAAPLAAQDAPKAKHLKPEELLQQADARNGLAGATSPWHVVAHFDINDPERKEKNAGTFEEWWFGPHSWKTVYKSASLNQTDIATEAGVFREGDARWPTHDEALVKQFLLAPLETHHLSGRDFDLIDNVRGKGAGELRCLSFNRRAMRDEAVGSNVGMNIDMLPSVCFVADTPILRFASMGAGRDLLGLDRLGQFQTQYIARELHFGRLNQPIVDIQLTGLAAIPAGTEAPKPGPDAKGPLTGPVELPDQQLEPASGFRDFAEGYRNVIPAGDKPTEIELKVTVGADGHVRDVAVVSGPSEFAHVVARALHKLTFFPFTVDGKPVEATEPYQQTFGGTGGPGGGRGRR